MIIIHSMTDSPGLDVLGATPVLCTPGGCIGFDNPPIVIQVGSGQAPTAKPGIGIQVGM